MNNNNNRLKVVRVNIKDIKQGDPKHHIFTQEILDDIEAIKEMFMEVRPLSTVEWLDGFSRDTHPEKEIALWLYMGKVYTRAIQDYSDDISYKNDIFKVVLMCTMEEDEYIVSNAKFDSLSEDEVREIIALYRR